jgi:hypothetical protein
LGFRRLGPLDATCAEHCAEILDILAGARSPGHHDLDYDARDQITVKVSVGEYSEEFLDT